jgi:predicted RNase H-like nuclease (RuvC/YqgF family)
VEEKMKSFPRQAKEIESLTSQLSAANNRIRVLDGALERQRTELMALREKVLLLEQRPSVAAHEAMANRVDILRRVAERLETEVEIAKEQSSHYKEKYRRVTDRQSVDSQMRGHANTLPPCDCPMCEARGM